MNRCKICGYETESKTGLSNHIKYFHVKNRDIESLEEYYKKFIYTGDLEKLGKCVVCGKPVPFISISRGYKVHCCHECSQKDPGVKKRKKENTQKALLEKYGVTNASQVPGSRDKTKATKKERYGSENYTNKEKYKQTMLERYGVENPNQVEEVRKKIKATNLERYGTAFPANGEENREKIKQRNLELYGVEWAQQRPEIKARSVQTSRERYGGVLMESPQIRSKIEKTLLNRYGVDSNLKLERTKEQRRKYWQEKLGVDSPLGDPEFRERALQGMEKKYGYRYAMQVPEFFEKQKEKAKGAYSLRRYSFKTGKVLSFLSNMERTFLEDCDELGLDIDKGDQVEYNFNEGQHIFNVDFRINYPDGSKQLVEIKGTNYYYYQALESGLQKAKNGAAEAYSTKIGYKPYLYLLNYEKGDIKKWI